MQEVYQDERILFVSRSTLSPDDRHVQIHAIVSTSSERNKMLAVTGALVASKDYFAEVLEGNSKHLDELMTDIINDTRHVDVEVVTREKIEARKFGRWSLAYNGRSTYVQKHIEAVARTRVGRAAVASANSLMQLIVEFSEMAPLL